MLGRRGTIAGLALLTWARAARSASVQDWANGAEMTLRFVRAGIPVDSYRVASTSMAPTLAIEDVVLADLRGAGTVPARGEMVSFKPPGETYAYIKRVIGLPGERVAMRGGRVFLDGAEVPRRFDHTTTLAIGDETLPGAIYVETLPGGASYGILKTQDHATQDEVGETTIPDGALFLLGDNRDNSVDSRFPAVGMLPAPRVLGRIAYRLRPNAGWLVDAASVGGLG